MCPLSDDALLDWALSPVEADPEVVRHLKACAPCRERSQAVLREQDLLRGAFAMPVPPAALVRGLVPVPPVPFWRRAAVAALLLAAVTVAVLLARTAGLSPHSRTARHRHAPTAPFQSDLGAMAQKLAAARETLPEAEDQKASIAYLELLAQEEGLYFEGMERYVDERSPLAPDQLQDLRRAVREFYSRLGVQENVSDASRSLRERVQMVLNEEQVLAFEEYSRQGLEWQRRTDIDLLMGDLSGELDLRFSEAERVRRALESNYPRADLPILRLDLCPPDPLVDNPVLSGAVRNSLDAAYVRKYDIYLGNARQARDRAMRIVLRHRAAPRPD